MLGDHIDIVNSVNGRLLLRWAKTTLMITAAYRGEVAAPNVTLTGEASLSENWSR